MSAVKFSRPVVVVADARPPVPTFSDADLYRMSWGALASAADLAEPAASTSHLAESAGDGARPTSRAKENNDATVRTL